MVTDKSKHRVGHVLTQYVYIYSDASELVCPTTTILRRSVLNCHSSKNECFAPPLLIRHLHAPLGLTNIMFGHIVTYIYIYIDEHSAHSLKIY